jgi:hypothetical protein
MRPDAPIRNQPLVTRFFRGNILTRTMSRLLENAQHRISISDINH